MAKTDALQAAAAAYATENWDQEAWRRLGRETGTTDILSGHHRLYRSQDFGDDDYPDAALEVMGQVLQQGVEPGTGEQGRMELLGDSMPDLREWVDASAPPRTKRLFNEYLAARDPSELPMMWIKDEKTAAREERARRVANVLDVFANVPVAAIDSEPFARDPEPDASTPEPPIPALPGGDKPSIFIVHGHDTAARDSIRIYVQKHTNVMPVSLAEQPGRGTTIIEKFEKYGGEADYVIVLLSPDDVGQTVARHANGETPDPRARQNVVLELGYFIGKLGRDKVLVMDMEVERPSDLAGLSYVEYPGENWKDDLREELNEAGLIS